MDITILGNVCIDKNTSENASYTAAGGPAVFMYKIYSQIQGVTTTIISPYGKDFVQIENSLPFFPTTPISDKTLIYENISRQGTREQKAYNRDYASPIPVSSGLEGILHTSDILFFTPLLPNMSNHYIQEVVQHANNKALKVLLPQGYYRQFAADNSVIHREFEEAANILPLIDIVVVSEQDGKDMLSLAQAWAKEYGVMVVVTLGEKGAIAITKDKETVLPTTPVPHSNVVDSVGAGDIFSASFAYAYKKTDSIEKAGVYANKIARARLFYPADNIQLDKKMLQV